MHRKPITGFDCIHFKTVPFMSDEERNGMLRGGKERVDGKLPKRAKVDADYVMAYFFRF